MLTGAGAALVAAVVVVAAAGCSDENNPLAEADRSRFDARAQEIMQDWPQVAEVRGRHADLLPVLEAERQGGTDERRLTLRVGHGGCVRQYGAWVEGTPKLVVVSGWEVADEDVETCTEELRIDKVEVELEQDLDRREVVDAATGQVLISSVQGPDG